MQMAAIDRSDRVHGVAIAPVDSKSPPRTALVYFAASEDQISKSKHLLPARIHISLLVHYLSAKTTEFPNLALQFLEGLEGKTSARGGATVVVQGYSHIVV